MFSFLKKLFKKKEEVFYQITPKGRYFLKLLNDNPNMKPEEALRVCNSVFDS